MVSGKPVLAVAVGLLALASLWYVQAPPRSDSAYRERAVKTAEMLRSRVQTTRIWLRALADDEATTPAASVAFRESEEGASKAASSFERVEPPAGTDAVRAQARASAAAAPRRARRRSVAAPGRPWLRSRGS